MSASEPSAAPEPLRIHLLGGVAVAVGSYPVPESAWRLRKAKNLLKLLALTPRHRLHRERVMDVLWPELDPEAAKRNLHRMLFTLRRVLQPDLPPGAASEYIALRDDVLVLCPAGNLWVDVDAFTTAAAVARRARNLAAYDQALALYAGDLLPDDRYEDWAVPRREEMCALYIALLLEATELHLRSGDQLEAIQRLQRLVATQPLAEEAHVALMHLYAAAGRRYDALRQYQQLQEILRRELDTEPGPAAQRLYAQIQAGRAPVHAHTFAFGAPSEAEGRLAPSTATSGVRLVPHAVSHAAPHSPPVGAAVSASLTGFVGRSRELEEVSALLASSRLLTLTGAGGCGKSRLAMEAASRTWASFCDGVVAVELAALTDPQLVSQVVASAVGVQEEQGRPLSQTLASALGTKQLLLVLDNCEHLREACAALCDLLLEACPDLRILATSRRRLRASCETDWCVPSLAAPRPECLPPFERLLDYDAIRLFCERAAAASRHDFALTPENAVAVVTICARLDGIPLAIELAARRRRYMTAEQIAARLDDALAVLGGSSSAGPTRHETLRATLDWSYDLLSQPERVLFWRLAVFAGGWTIEAAEAICAEEPLEQPAILDLLARLVDESLVTVEKRDATMRYRFLEPIRQYAHAKLVESGESERARHRHAHWYRALAEEATPYLGGRGVDAQRRWLHRLDPDLDNLRAALAWAVERNEVEVGSRLTASLRTYWYCRNLLTEGRRWMDAMLGLPAGEARPELRAKVFYDASVLAMYQGDLERAAELARASQDLCRELRDTAGVMRALVVLGGVAEFRGDYARAVECHTECLKLARERGDRPLAIISLSNLADVAAAQGDLDRSAELYQESLALARQQESPRNIAMALTNLGKVALRRGELDHAALFLAEALAIARGFEEARGIAENLLPLGHVALARGDHQRALAHYAEALDLYHRGGIQVGIAQSLESIARIAMAYQDWTSATWLSACAQALRERAGLPLTPAEQPAVEHTLASLRAAFGGDAFAAAWAQGRISSVDQIVAQAASIVAEWQANPPTIAEHRARPARLTARQLGVAQLMAEGLTNREIADRLNVSIRTVDTHVTHIFAKLGCTSRSAVAIWWAMHQTEDT